MRTQLRPSLSLASHSVEQIHVRHAWLGLALLVTAGAWSGCSGDDTGDGTMTYVPPVTSGTTGGGGGTAGAGMLGGVSTPLPDGGTTTLVPTIDAGSNT